eukprot:CAMPEP_0206269942 /NCGR_PEP_ID=MMETSP0047_2-20121206/32591_1 /ASSEMBLY_ACC=CAM_ASM_000192 /TAXON_ID=195065 /ORGANISM="Chroomonas mesostigmatica_cf, Strain CCMP1168" /LENGTH=117 /DNA_ID=CAMNT_0053698525 /DNA_START=123 /DNA_END=476 /DNA_ORIENTATION=+
MTPPTAPPRLLGKPRELLDERGHELLVPRSLCGHAHHVHVGLECLRRHLRRSLEQRPDVHVPPQVGEAAGDDLLAAVVAVLAHLGNKHARAAPGLLGELLHGQARLSHLIRTSRVLS